MSIERHIIRTPLKERYGAPPFSILDARQGYWQDRKRWWTRKGIRSELGRGEALIAMSKSNMKYMFGKKEYDVDQLQKEGILLSDEEVATGGDSKGSAKTFAIGDKATWNAEQEAKKDLRAIPGGGTGKNSAWLHKKEDGSMGAALQDEDAFKNRATGTSIFDPVLTELMYDWFCPDNGSILDPFCGGSVRGIVAAHGNHQYAGMELRSDQVQANRIQGLEILGNTDYPMPNWVVGDALDIQEKIGDKWDMIFSCPPYGDLEVYSEDDRDLSTMEHHEFLDTYRTIIQRSVEMLKDNRFAVFVVGDFRNEDGFYRNFVSDTIDAFQSAGATLYNECILITVAGSLPIRVHKQFANNRKLGKTHQNVLIFFKGDPKTIQDEFRYLDVEDKTEDVEWL
tara:strand:+ start:28824 stop:30011 length:1188 start_codon:yes stop_codon:yes gene_type:complete